MMMLGVKIDQLSKPEALVKAREFVFGEEQKKIFTPNPEMLVKAYNDPWYKAVLNRGDLNLCDGFGIRLFSGFKVSRISGVDFMKDMCGLAENEGKSVFLLGSGSVEVVTGASENLKRIFPNLLVAGVHSGPSLHETKDKLIIDDKENEEVLSEINALKPDILFVAFGMGKQEKWIDTNLSKMPTVKVAVGVGGAFEFLSGRLRRAPLLLRYFGLEWLWRLMLQPWRIKRIFNATAHFSYLMIKQKFFL